MATIKDIAELAGVSPTTVSNVIHNKKGKISTAKLELIKHYIDELNYIPNVGAMILAGQNTKIIGVITDYSRKYSTEVLEDPFMSAILAAIENEIRCRGYYTMLHVAQGEQEVVSLAETWKVSGLLIMGLESEECIEILEKARVPIVFIDCYLKDTLKVQSKKIVNQYYNIGLEDKQGGYIITKYLISLGHKNILFIGDQFENDTVNRLRQEGYIKALKEAGLGIPKCDKMYMYQNQEKRELTLNHMYEYWKQNIFTAIFFCSDYYAFQASRYFLEKNVHIPRDLSIVGFDDNKFAQFAYPSLTTIHQDVKARGEAAVDMLDSIIKGEKIIDPIVRFPVKVIERESTRKI
ncbi:MAG: hypothetical protein BKP49_08835 [Treponema sp. CETP13]|nr:MAG: hypothetical protein BKP49_08835 [Treponema sp. CETP13]